MGKTLKADLQVEEMARSLEVSPSGYLSKGPFPKAVSLVVVFRVPQTVRPVLGLNDVLNACVRSSLYETAFTIPPLSRNLRRDINTARPWFDVGSIAFQIFPNVPVLAISFFHTPIETLSERQNRGLAKRPVCRD